jgi:hypothetical protein
MLNVMGVLDSANDKEERCANDQGTFDNNDSEYSTSDDEDETSPENPTSTPRN